MVRPSRCLFAYLVLAVLSGGLLVAEPAKTDKPAGPDLSEFKTVDTCAKTRVSRTGPVEPAAALPGYLGVHAEKNVAGQIAVVEIEPESPAAKAGVLVG